MQNCEILGILNLTHDSFSDGGRFLDFQNAQAQAIQLWIDSANTIDLGAQSSNPDAEPVPEALEWERLENLIHFIQKELQIPLSQNGTEIQPRPKISIDSFKPGILKKALQHKIDYWNDITALRERECLEVLDSSSYIPELILMYSHSQTDKAWKESRLRTETIVDTICHFMDEKRKSLIAHGIPEEKLIFDPGMGFFLGSDANLSYMVLRELKRFKKEFSRVLISVSRKSFLTASIGQVPPMERKAATLAAEIHSYLQGIDLIRTHEPRPLRQAIQVLSKINLQ